MGVCEPSNERRVNCSSNWRCAAPALHSRSMESLAVRRSSEAFVVESSSVSLVTFVLYLNVTPICLEAVWRREMRSECCVV